MKKYCKFIYAFPLIAALLAHSSCQANHPQIDNSTVKQLDINRYMGKWYEIARYDHPFERGMSHVYTEYSSFAIFFSNDKRITLLFLPFFIIKGR